MDLDGVLVASSRPLPGAPGVIDRLHRAEVPFRLMTNATSLSRAGLAEDLRRNGFDVGPWEVLTATVATASYLRRRYPDARCFLLGGAGATEDLAGVRLADQDADVVVVAGADDEFTPENLNLAFRMLMGGAALVAMHRNLHWATADGLKLDAGAYLGGLEQAAGVKAEVAGKPSAEFFREALTDLGLPAGRVAMIGDDIDNDVRAAQAVGLTGILVRTGKFRDVQLASPGASPDHVIGSIEDLPSLLGLP